MADLESSIMSPGQLSVLSSFSTVGAANQPATNQQQRRSQQQQGSSKSSKLRAGGPSGSGSGSTNGSNNSNGNSGLGNVVAVSSHSSLALNPSTTGLRSSSNDPFAAVVPSSLPPSFDYSSQQRGGGGGGGGQSTTTMSDEQSFADDGSTTSTIMSSEIFKPYYKALALGASGSIDNILGAKNYDAGDYNRDGRTETGAANTITTTQQQQQQQQSNNQQLSSSSSSSYSRPGQQYLDLLQRIENSGSNNNNNGGGGGGGGGGGSDRDDASTAGVLSVVSSNTYNQYDDLLYGDVGGGGGRFSPISGHNDLNNHQVDAHGGVYPMPSLMADSMSDGTNGNSNGKKKNRKSTHDDNDNNNNNNNADSHSIASTTRYDDPSLDTPVGISIYLKGPSPQYAHSNDGHGTCLIGKMLLMKSTSLSKLRSLLKHHCRRSLPPSFVFVDGSKSESYSSSSKSVVSPPLEPRTRVYDACRFTRFDETGVACVDMYVRQTPAPRLPFSRCSSFEDYLKMSKEQTLRLRRMAAAEETGAVAALKILDSFTRRYQFRITDVFVKDGDKVNFLAPPDLQRNLRAVRCVLPDDVLAALAAFLDDGSSDDEKTINASELDEALRQYRRSDKAASASSSSSSSSSEGIYVSASINMTRNAVKRLLSAPDGGGESSGGDVDATGASSSGGGGGGGAQSPRSFRRLGVLTPIGNPSRSGGGVATIARMLESVADSDNSNNNNNLNDSYDADYVECVTSVGGGDNSSIAADGLSYVSDMKDAAGAQSRSNNHSNNNNNNPGRASRRGKKHRPKVRRLTVSDAEIERMLDGLFAEGDSAPASSRISFTEFLDYIKSTATSGDTAGFSVSSSSSSFNAALCSQQLYSLLSVLRDEWASEEASVTIANLGDVPTLSNEDINLVIHFIKATSDTPHNPDINCKELEEAFRIIKRQSAADELTPGVVSTMRVIINRMRRKKLRLDDLFKELDKSGDGIVSHSEIADWLSSFGVSLDNINSTLKYLDPDNDGELETVELANALRKAEITVNRIEVDEKDKAVVLERCAQADAAIQKTLSMQPEGFTTLEIELLSSFLDPSGDGDITLPELEASFRKARRGRAERPLVEEGKKLLVRLRTMLQSSGKAVPDWYQSCLPPILTFEYDAEKAARRTLSTKDLRTGLLKLCSTQSHSSSGSSTSKAHAFSESDILKLVRYMDPSGEGDVSAEEIADAFVRVDTISDAERIEFEVGGTLLRIEHFMKEKGMRLQDFFVSLDKQNIGAVTVRELTYGLSQLSEPSGAVKALMKRRDEALTSQEIETQHRNQELSIVNERIKFANDSGAAAVLRTLERTMKEKGLRLSDLFREIDKDGSGLVSPAELRLGMRLMSEPKDEAIAPLRRAREKAKALKQEMIRKMMEYQRFEDKVTSAHSCGAADVIFKLDNFMRRKQLRVKDLFNLLNKSGSETASVAELHRALAKARLNIPIDEIEKMIAFMDTSGDMEVDSNELEVVICDFRRFAYEQQNRHMVSSKKLPLCVLYPSLGHIFVSTDIILGKFSRPDLAFGLRRLRGDIAMPPIILPIMEEECTVAVDALSRFHAHIEATKQATDYDEETPPTVAVGGADPLLALLVLTQPDASSSTTTSAATMISLSDVKQFMTKVSSEPIIPKRKKHVKLVSTARLPPIITDENIDQICKFVDPSGSKGVSMKALEAAFRRVWKASNYTAIVPEVSGAMKDLMSVMRSNRLSLENVLSSAPRQKSSTGGLLTRENLTSWLSVSYPSMPENSVSALSSFVDPDNTNAFTYDDISMAFRKAYVFVCRKELLDSRASTLTAKAEAAERALRLASETPKLVFSDAEVDQIVSFLDPKVSGSVSIAAFESAFRRARRAQGVDSFLQKAKNLVRRFSELLSAKNLNVEQFIAKSSTSVSSQLAG